ncbi:MAG TPA: F0F1 ATP synthase subunit B [Hyphomicrobium sp.]|jgi:F-type H+-transporting ATPase subunit b|nr:F0F1 ATP synthase subunit B [Hyphomicrobium sp.]
MIAAIPALVLAAAAAETAAEGKSGGLPQLNPADFAPQLIWLAITFVVLYFILARVALPRIGEVIEERRDRVQRDLDAAERFKKETDAALAAYERALAEARAKASSMAKDMRDKLATETDKERASVEGHLSAKLADAEARIAATKTKALSSVNEIAAETASAVVSKLLGEDVSPAEIKKVLQPAAE